MIKRIGYCLLMAAVLSGCHEKKEKVPEKQPLSKDALAKYQEVVKKLDTNNVETITTAAHQYAILFKQEDEATRDAGFLIFDRYYEEVGKQLEENIGKDTLNLMDLISYDGEGGEHKPVSKELQAYSDRLNRNGFKVWDTEGTPYIEEKRDFIATCFYRFVSRPMREYLEQLNRENKEGFQEDAGLTISPELYADRIAWWDSFIKANPDFVLTGKASVNRKRLVSFFLKGMDNTPVLSSGENNLDSYFKDAYSYMQEKYPNSASNKLVQPYYQALLKKDVATADALLEKYHKEGLIMDFSEGE